MITICGPRMLRDWGRSGRIRRLRDLHLRIEMWSKHPAASGSVLRWVDFFFEAFRRSVDECKTVGEGGFVDSEMVCNDWDGYVLLLPNPQNEREVSECLCGRWRVFRVAFGEYLQRDGIGTIVEGGVVDGTNGGYELALLKKSDVNIGGCHVFIARGKDQIGDPRLAVLASVLQLGDEGTVSRFA